jgi:hypothetical protein
MGIIFPKAVLLYQFLRTIFEVADFALSIDIGKAIIDSAGAFTI